MPQIFSQIIEHLGDIKTPLALAGVVFVIAGVVLYQIARQRPGGRLALVIVLSLGGLCALALIFAFLPNQTFTVYGSVFEDAPGKAPVPGAHVFMRGTTYQARSTITDTDGNFSFSLPNSAENRDFDFSVAHDRYQPFDKMLTVSVDANLLIPLEHLVNPAQAQKTNAKIVSTAAIAEDVHPVLPAALQVSRPQSATRPGQVTRFQWLYQFATPHEREWELSSDGHWQEYYGNDHNHPVSSFAVEGAAVVDGCPGTILRRDDATLLEAFVPDRGCKLMWARFRSAGGNWQFLGEMLDVTYAS